MCGVSIQTGAVVSYVVSVHYLAWLMTGATDHLKSKCPQKEAIEQGAVVARKENETAGADEDAYHEKLRFEESQRRAKLADVKLSAIKKRPKIVKF
jgi:hypothetical protein